MKKHIVDRNKEIRGKKSQENCRTDQIKTLTMTKIWEIKRRIERKTKKIQIKH